MRGSNWPTAVLTSAFGLQHEAGKLHMAVCVGYLEANAHHTPDTMTVIGLVSSKARWQTFEARWPHVLHAEGLTAFNGRDFIQRTGEFL